MPGIIGTVISIKDLYEKKDTAISYFAGTKQIDLFELKKNRKYIVPVFQREIRWKKGNLLTLISDVKNKPKFLGNIILTKTSNDDFEILDGQQRTTIIYLLVKYFEFKFSDRFNIFELCDLELNSFKGFGKLFDKYFELGEFAAEELEAIKDTDDYQQYEKYLDLWKEINNCSIFKVPADTEDFLKNLAKCTVNVIVSMENEEEGIESFLDVNLKGVKLDTEDIFKGYLCSIDNSQDIHDIWSRLKKIDAKLNSKKRQVYPLMTVIEHYLRCKLLTNDAYRDIEFNSDFVLSKEQEVEGKKYSENTHLVAVIRNKSFLKECLNEIELILKLINGIKSSTGISEEYVHYIDEYNGRVSQKKKIDDKERDVMFNLTKKIVMDKDKAPNCLLIRCFLDVFLDKSASKLDFQKIYAVSTATLFFSLFETKKDLEIIKEMIKPENWYEEMCDYIFRQLNAQISSGKTINVAYKDMRNNANNPQKFRCKTLATVYDFYDVSATGIQVKKGKMAELELFLNDENKYSLEHFIINDSGKIVFTTDSGISVSYEYPANVAKYKKSLLNYLFINENLNERLGSAPVNVKIQRLTEGDLVDDYQKEQSQFSRMIVEQVRASIKMPNLDDVKSEEEAEKLLTDYFQNRFEDELLIYMKNVFIKMRELN